ncbi:MAG: hypothetical protein A3J37_00475 [Alphaproteobacteria bacterium RIFCSPHIGHO2_12_FULL_45_9]|nr:MAG: hypothetical protein A3B66_04920 [Alphaproteobacteria bacterium RIFCSPHIGHO2_02_FULL_46_13]OFW96553.1 MAG: hypothetical protein A3J37_00475 [Alphaproteobacteria bacterium RIFCSPHIGHO2_12_FULL_45_9]
MDHPDPKIAETQKLIHRVTRLAGVGFLGVGILILATGGDIILGSVLTIIGLTDIVLVPRIIEKMMIAKLKQRNDEGQ